MLPKIACGPGVVIVIPTLGRPVSLNWAMMFRSLHPPINYNLNVMTIYGKPVAQARNEACEYALKEGHKYIFFLGDDTVPPAYALKQLIFRAEQSEDIGVIGGVYCAKGDPAAPLVFKENGRGSYWNWKVGEFFEVTGLGMDCTLVKTELLKEMEPPWFKTVDEDKFMDGINQAQQWTEDLWFLKRVVEETPFKVFCDGSLLCEHEDVYSGKTYTLPSNSLPCRQLKVEKKLKAIDVGCGSTDRSKEFPDHELVRVDIREEVNPDYRCDVRSLPFKTEEFDLVFSSHVLEHFGRKEWREILKEWIRVLKKTGVLILILPNIKWAIEHFEDEKVQNDVMNVFYGGQSNPFDKHFNGFWPERITQELEALGLTIISLDCEGYNMLIKAGYLTSTPVKKKRIRKKK
jgi:SAM-dependent methyltransferase